MKKAREDLQAAKIMLEHRKLAQSVNRSYYAIFHAVRALLVFDLFDSKLTEREVFQAAERTLRRFLEWLKPCVK